MAFLEAASEAHFDQENAMRARERRTRLSALIFALVVWCGCAKKPTTPVKMGLWEVATRREAACPAEVAAYIRKNGLLQQRGAGIVNCFGDASDLAATVKTHACFTESSWQQKKEHLAAKTTAENCLYTKPFSEDENGMSVVIECKGAGMTVTVGTSAVWPDREHMHWMIASLTSFQGISGNSVVKTEIDSRFLTSDCGSVQPGESIVTK